MFLTATKVCMIEALREVMGENNQKLINRVGFQRIDIEYPEDSQDWPALLVQFRPTTVSWTGVNPDGFSLNSTSTQYTRYRRGSFEGYFDLSILALTSQERDRLWDSLVELFMFGKNNAEIREFYYSLSENDLIDLTLQETTISPLGDSASMGTPWDPNALTYEASLRINTVGQFWADVYNLTLVPLSDVVVSPYTEGMQSFPEPDQYGAWKELSDSSS